MPAPEMPAPADPYAGDWMLQAWLRYQFGGEDRAAVSRLTALAQEVTGPLRRAHWRAEAQSPTLVRYDPWGARVDRVETSPGWEVLRQAAARHAVVALPYLPGPCRQWGPAVRVVQHGLVHLFGPESATFSCPVAMSDGAAALLGHPEVAEQVRSAWLPGLVSTDPATASTSGQWMTETTGGSDLSGATTRAVRESDGRWRLSGEKWFCSAVDSPLAVVLARPEGAGEGSRALVPFLLPRVTAGGAPAEGVRIHRLKEKLGTRALPTAEVGLSGAVAYPLGDPGTPGLARMMRLVRVARLHNSAAAAAGMRRGLAYAWAFAGQRRVAGGLLSASPLHRTTLATTAVAGAAAFVLAGHAFALLGRVEHGTVDDRSAEGTGAAEAEVRLVAPLAKLATGKLAVWAASELVEAFGGAGYIEETGVPRLLRDAQVLPIWEGTTNVLALDVLRAVAREGAHAPLLARIHRAVARAEPAVAQRLAPAVARLEADLSAAAADPTAARVVAGARDLALRAAHTVAAALLVELAADGDPATAAAARLWTRGWVAGEEVGGEAYECADLLCGG